MASESGSVWLLNISPNTYTVVDFLDWQRNKNLVLSPSFQRRPIWKPQHKAFFMDTIVKGLPVPIIFLREASDLTGLRPIREVVDGQQRLRTLISFIEPSALEDYDPSVDHFQMSRNDNPDLAGKSFDSWPQQVKTDVLSYKFSVMILPSNTEDRDVLEIFARLNATGIRLNAQEFRNAEYNGVFKKLMYQLGYEQLTRWREWKILTEYDIARMSEVEITSDFVTTMMGGIRSRTQPVLDEYYKRYDDSFQVGEEVSRRFRWTFDAIDDIVGRQLPNLVFRNQTMFHALFSYVYDLAFGLGSELTQKRPKRLPHGISGSVDEASLIVREHEVPEDLRKALDGRTTHAASRMARFNFLKQVCEGAYDFAPVS